MASLNTPSFSSSFLEPAVLGDDLLLECRALRLGRNMAHLECRVTKRAAEGGGEGGGEDRLVAVATQSRYVATETPPHIQKQIEVIAALEKKGVLTIKEEGEDNKF